MSVEYWNEMHQEWRPSILGVEDMQRINQIAGWEMYREVE